MTGDDLHEQAKHLSGELSRIASVFAGKDIGFSATLVQQDALNGGRAKALVRPSADSRVVPLRVGSRTLFALEVEYRCVADQSGSYLTVDESFIKVRVGDGLRGEPLFRYEYNRNSNDDLPCAHLHVHAHRDAFTHAMAIAGQEGATRRKERRGVFKEAHMAEVHFPLGGHRFRPGLEDVLQMFATEFGVVPGEGWAQILKESRLTYRREQVKAAVRDCPESGAKALVELGYVVMPPRDGHVTSTMNRLVAY